MTVSSRWGRRLAGVAVAAAVVGVTGGCGSSAAGPGVPYCEVRFDVTGSAAGQSADQLSSAERFMARACAEGTVRADLIDRESQASLAGPVLVELTPKGLRGNATYDEPARRKAQAEAAAALSGLIETATTTATSAAVQTAGACTDIFGALIESQRTMATVEAGRPRRLLLASDGLQTCGINLTTLSLDKASIDASLAEVAARGLQADLSGVEVWLQGIGRGNDLGAARQTGLHAYWHSFFAKAGARVVVDTDVIR